MMKLLDSKSLEGQQPFLVKIETDKPLWVLKPIWECDDSYNYADEYYLGELMNRSKNFRTYARRKPGGTYEVLIYTHASDPRNDKRPLPEEVLDHISELFGLSK